MSNRLKSSIILGFILPTLFLALGSLGSLALYKYTVKTAQARQLMLATQKELQIKMQSTEQEQTLMRNSRQVLQGYFSKATTDEFIFTLTSVSTEKAEIISSSSIPVSTYPSLSIKAAQELTLRGSSNALITALGSAQTAFPAVLPIKWQLKKASKLDELELSARFIILDLNSLTIPHNQSGINQKKS